MPQVDKYDRVDFVCPTLKIAVNLLDGYSRPTEEMNENLFRMKWNGTEDELKSHIKSGTMDSFCDPKSSAVDHLYSCKNGKEGKGLGVTFKLHFLEKQNNYENGKIYVFFNNGDDGKAKTLHSKTKKCTMLFPVKVTKTAANKKHDMSYGKSFNPNANLWQQSNGSCVSTFCQQKNGNKPRTRRHHLLSSLKNLQNSSTPTHEWETGFFSTNNILIVTIVILSVLTTFLMILLMVSRRGLKVDKYIEHDATIKTTAV